MTLFQLLLGGTTLLLASLSLFFDGGSWFHLAAIAFGVYLLGVAISDWKSGRR